MNTVISQALATGLPVITTKHSGLSDQVKEYINGFLVEEKDFKALAEKIAWLMDQPELLPVFAQNGREHILKNYNSNLLITKQLDYYYQTCSEDINAEY